MTRETPSPTGGWDEERYMQQGASFERERTLRIIEQMDDYIYIDDWDRRVIDVDELIRRIKGEKQDE